MKKEEYKRNKFILVAIVFFVLGISLAIILANSGITGNPIFNVGKQSTNITLPTTEKIIPQQNQNLQNNLILENNVEVSSKQVPFPSIVNQKNMVFSQTTNIGPESIYKENIIQSFSQDQQSQKYNGYIIEFKDAPKLQYKKQLEDSKSIPKEEITKDVDNYKADLVNKQNLIKNKIYSNYPKAKISSQFQLAFNGISIKNISEQDIEKIKQMPEVKQVYKNYEVKAFLNESIPLINADDVWRMQIPIYHQQDPKEILKENITGKGIKIAIIDTGIDYTHPDLGGCFGYGCKVEGGYDFVNNDNDPIDDQGHGTHCASIAAGTGIASNGLLKGVAPDAKLYAYKVLDSSGSGWESWIISGIEKAVQDNVDIISMSLGGYGDPNDPMSQAIDNAVNSGVTAVIAAGNSGPSENTIGSPGCARKAITIGASDKQDKIAWFSSRGPTYILTLKPDVVAPGVNICAARGANAWPDRLCYGDNYVSISGTSMATPMVAGTVALLKQKNPTWTPDEIKMALRNTAIKLNDPSTNYPLSILAQGYGRIDALTAVQSSQPPIAFLKNLSIQGNKMNITGTAKSNKFKQYVLSYGEGKDPITFVNFYLSNNPVNEEVLYSNFNIPALNEGHNAIKLSVTNMDNKLSEDKILFFVDNIQINEPQDNDIYRLGDTLKINGSLKYSGNFVYNISYGFGESPTQWHTNGVTLINGGVSSSPRINSTLAIWNTSQIGISDGDFVTIKITVNFNNKNFEEKIYSIYLDPTLKKGWPQKIPSSWENFGFAPVITYDFNNSKNIVTGYGRFDGSIDNPQGTLFIYRPNGGYTSTGIFEGIPQQFYSITDLNSFDNEYNLIISSSRHFLDTNISHGGMFVYDSLGNFKWVWRPNEGTDTYLYGNSIYDINNDGNPEIIVASNPSQDINAISANGNKLWSYHPNGDFFCSSLNLNSFSFAKTKNSTHILFFTYGWPDNTQSKEAILNVLDQNGNKIWSYSFATENTPGQYVISSSIYVSQTNSDNYFGSFVIEKINYMTGDKNVKVYKLTYDGSFSLESILNIDQIENKLSLSDIDNDGEIEIILIGSVSHGLCSGTGFNNKLLILKQNGSLILEKEYSTNGASSATAADINNDGYKEILFTGYCAHRGDDWTINAIDNKIFATDRTGQEIAGFPKLIKFNNYQPPIIDDVDNDGLLDLVASDIYGVYVWNLNVSYNSQSLDWPMFAHDSQHTGNYNFKTQPTCVDSDGGKNYYVKGITVGLAGDGVMTTRTDMCWPHNYFNDSYDYVAEWFCWTNPDDNKIYAINTNEKCTNGCSNGACLPACIDSDGGLNYNLKGTVTYLGTDYTDYCGSWYPGSYKEANLLEFSCYNNTKRESLYKCVNGCSNGACSKFPIRPPLATN